MGAEKAARRAAGKEVETMSWKGESGLKYTPGLSSREERMLKIHSIERTLQVLEHALEHRGQGCCYILDGEVSAAISLLREYEGALTIACALLEDGAECRSEA